LYQLGPMVYVQFRTRDWDDFGYRDYGNYARVALFPEHLRPADPGSPGVVGFTQAIAREVAAQQQFANCRHHGGPSDHGGPSGNGSGKRDTRDGQGPVHKPASAKGSRSNGAKPPPVKPHPSELAKTSGRGRSAKAHAADAHSLKPVRSI